MLRLYSTALSANGRKPLALMNHLEIAAELVEVNVYEGEGRQPELLAINPLGKVPTLVDGDLTLTESNAILVYLCERYGDGRLFAEDVVGRARILSWLFWEASQWQPALVSVLTPFVAPLLVPEAPAVEAGLRPDWADVRLAPLLALLDSRLTEREFLAGSSLTIADLSVACISMFFPAVGFPFERFPSVERWYRSIERLDAWKATAVGPWRQV